MMNMTKQPLLTRPLLYLLAVTSGLTISNIYYIQPLLAQISQYYRLGHSTAGILALLSLLGIVLGLLFLLPLSDRTEKKRVILRTITGTAGCLLLLYVSPNAGVTAAALLGLGFCSIIPQLCIPFAMSLAAPENRGSVIGDIMSGLLMGILLSRAVSGYIASLLGWKAIYGLAFAVTIVLWFLLRRHLPPVYIPSALSYSQSLRSLPALCRRYPVLRCSALLGAANFLAFNLFWAGVPFFLQGPPYYMQTSHIGLLGLAGAAGAALSPVIGKLSDSKGPRLVIGLSIAMMLLSYLVLAIYPDQLFLFLAGVLFLDLGAQAGNISNQDRIHQLSAGARSRITAIYMISFFLGGAAGSYLGPLCVSLFHWTGLCIAGIVSQVLACAVFLWDMRKKRPAAN